MQNHGSARDLDVIAVQNRSVITKKLRRLLQLRHPFKIQLCDRLSVLRLLHVGDVEHPNGQSALPLIGTIGLNVRVADERFSFHASAFRTTNLKISPRGW